VTATTNDRQEIFEQIRAVLEEYSPPLAARVGTVKGKLDYHLWSEKHVVIQGRPRDEVFFAGLIIQKGYVGFYFMPVYAEPERKELFAPELLELLKGKSCFHVRRLDEGTLEQIRAALAKGFELYRERGWV
jgi:hypothetical protein